MRVSSRVTCQGFPCTDVKRECFIVPGIDVKPENVSEIMISEASPPGRADYYYAKCKHRVLAEDIAAALRLR
jgi:hypothetical protein